MFGSEIKGLAIGTNQANALNKARQPSEVDIVNEDLYGITTTNTSAPTAAPCTSVMRR